MSESTIEAVRKALAEAHARGGMLAIVALGADGKVDPGVELCFFGETENGEAVDVLLSERDAAVAQAERLKELSERHRSEIREAQVGAERRNRQLDALGLVWCDGGCTGGMRRFGCDPVTEDLIVELTVNAARACTWWVNRQGKGRPDFSARFSAAREGLRDLVGARLLDDLTAETVKREQAERERAILLDALQLSAPTPWRAPDMSAEFLAEHGEAMAYTEASDARGNDIGDFHYHGDDATRVMSIAAKVNAIATKGGDSTLGFSAWWADVGDGREHFDTAGQARERVCEALADARASAQQTGEWDDIAGDGWSWGYEVTLGRVAETDRSVDSNDGSEWVDYGLVAVGAPTPGDGPSEPAAVDPAMLVGLDTDWPVFEVVRHLVRATGYLLHDYDRHGWEVIDHARRTGIGHIKSAGLDLLPDEFGGRPTCIAWDGETPASKADPGLVALAHRLGWDCTGDEDSVTVDSLAEWVRELEMRARQSVVPDMAAVDHLIATLALDPSADAAATLRVLRGFSHRLKTHAKQQVVAAGDAMWTVNYWMGREGAYIYFGAVIQRLLDGVPVDALGQVTDLPPIIDPIRETLTPDQMDAIERVMVRQQETHDGDE